MDNLAVKYIEKINHSAKAYFLNGIKDNKLRLCRYYNDGVISIIEENDFVVIYIVFDNDFSNLNIIIEIEKYINQIINKLHPKKSIFLNIYYPNQTLINYFYDKGFKTDMNGIEFVYFKEDAGFEKNDVIYSIKPFEEEKIDDYMNLIDNAFNTIHNKNHYLSEFKEDNSRNDFGAMYINDELVGLYTLYNEYIKDFAINAKYQKKGYGSILIKHCLNILLNERNYKQIYLRTEVNNLIAQSFYKKNGFKLSGMFSENTYRP